jgi:hypothetical protein
MAKTRYERDTRRPSEISEQDLERVAGQREEICGFLNLRCGRRRESRSHELDQTLAEISFSRPF